MFWVLWNKAFKPCGIFSFVQTRDIRLWVVIFKEWSARPVRRYAERDLSCIVIVPNRVYKGHRYSLTIKVRAHCTLLGASAQGIVSKDYKSIMPNETLVWIFIAPSSTLSKTIIGPIAISTTDRPDYICTEFRRKQDKTTYRQPLPVPVKTNHTITTW